MLAATTVSAQPSPSTNYTSIEVELGKLSRIGVYAQADRNCSSPKLPIVRVAEPPSNGTLTVRPGEIQMKERAHCPDTRVPAQIVLYQPREAAAGRDHVMYSVTYPNGEIALYDIAIRFKEPARAN
jgi:hypothetical protein